MDIHCAYLIMLSLYTVCMISVYCVYINCPYEFYTMYENCRIVVFCNVLCTCPNDICDVSSYCGVLSYISGESLCHHVLRYVDIHGVVVSIVCVVVYVRELLLSKMFLNKIIQLYNTKTKYENYIIKH